MRRESHLKGLVKLALVALVAVTLQSCGRSFYADWPTNHRTEEARQRGEAAEVNNTPRRVRVERGDTLSEIAIRNDVPFRALAAANDIRAPYTIYVGQRLTIPAPPTHTVRRGESLSTIAARYDITTHDLQDQNRIRRADRIYAGQVLSLPWAAGTTGAGSVTRNVAAASTSPSRRPATSASSNTVTERPVERAAPQPRRVTPQPASVVTARDLTPPPRSGQGFMWPVDGQIISNYGPKPGGQHNDGINISVPEGTPVRAAEAGVVIYSGNEVPGYGNLVLIRHDNGYVTAYAHNSRLNVEQGHVVERGEIVALSGRSGRVSEPQVHFEVRRNSEAVNPAQFMAGA